MGTPSASEVSENRMPITATCPVGALQFGDSGPSSWPDDDLVRRLCLALGIAERAIGILGDNGYRDGAAPEDSFGPDKPLAETAMLLHVAAGVTGHLPVKVLVDELSQVVATHARSQRTACAIALHPTICFQLAMPHILLTRSGRPNSRFDRLLALSAAAHGQRGREVVPHRAIEGYWLRSLWGDTPPEKEFDAAASNSVLNHPLDLLWGTREDAYAHTHAFMYFTDFGYACRPLPRSRSELLNESAAILARSLLLEDYDLAAEVLMAWPMTGAPWSAAAAFGFRVLAKFEDKIGFLLAGNGLPEKFHRLAGISRTKYALAATYHTAYVMGMLCALALRPGKAPPRRIPGLAVAAGLVDELLGMISIADTPWQHTFHQLEPVERGALAPFLFDIALLENARRGNLPAVAQLLSMALRHGLANSPVCAQSAELLERVAICSNPA